MGGLVLKFKLSFTQEVTLSCSLSIQQRSGSDDRKCLQDEAPAKDWDLKTFETCYDEARYKTQTDDMKSEIKEKSSEVVRATCKGKLRGKPSKQKSIRLRTEMPQM